MNKDKAKAIIDKVDIVSFDIYDTIIKRFAKPYEVFDLVEEAYNKQNSEHINGFKKIRIEAEIMARNQNNKEITLDDIYTNVEKQYKNFNSNELKSLEENIEKEIIYLNEEIYDLYRYSLNNNKEIIFTSDMYLSKEIISEILSRFNISYSKLFLSSDLGVRKSDGSLFQYILDDYSKKDDLKIVHIGDNLKSDYIQAKLKKIKAIKVNNKREKKSSKNYKIDIMDKIISNLSKTKNFKNSYVKFGYESLGPLMYGFLQYLNDNINDKYENIVFLSREGQFIKRCYDYLFSTKSSYLYVSRKSISSYLFADKGRCLSKDIISYQSITQLETVKMFLKRLGLYNTDNISLLKKYNIDDNELYLKHKEVINTISLELAKNSDKNYDNFKEYISYFNFNNKTCIVDIGWAGTMQDLLQLELKKDNIIIDGYYLGVRKKRASKNKYGYLFGFNNNEQLENVSRSMVGFLETLFAADHGTTTDYEKEENIIKPKLKENDISIDAMLVIKDIQDGAIEFIKDFKDIEINKLISFSSYEYSYSILSIGLNPPMQIIDIFKKIQLFDENRSNIIGQHSLIYYLFHLKQFRKDFVESTWKNAFLKNLFKLNLNYYYFFKLAFKFKKGD